MLRLECIGVGGKMNDKNYVEKIKESWGSVWYYFDKSIFWWIIESYPLDLMGGMIIKCYPLNCSIRIYLPILFIS